MASSQKLDVLVCEIDLFTTGIRLKMRVLTAPKPGQEGQNTFCWNGLKGMGLYIFIGESGTFSSCKGEIDLSTKKTTILDVK